MIITPNNCLKSPHKLKVHQERIKMHHKITEVVDDIVWDTFSGQLICVYHVRDLIYFHNQPYDYQTQTHS